MATTFQIIDKKTNQPVSLNDIDRLYCEQTGREYSDKGWAIWYPFLETILTNYADLADKASDVYIIKSLGIKPKSRDIDFHTVARLYLVIMARSFYQSEPMDELDKSYLLYRELIQFYHNNQDNYYITFSL